MTDNALAILIRSTLLQLLASQGITDMRVLAAYQPTGQGREGRAIYFFPITDTRYGWQQRKDIYDDATGGQVHIETQLIESQFQVQGLAPTDPANIEAMTAKDITNLAAMLISSQPFIQALSAQGVGLQRITAIRSPFFVNDQGQFEASPSFDFTVSHKRSITQITPSIESVELDQTRV